MTGTVLHNIPPPPQHTRPQYLVYDTLSDRRDIWEMLQRLHPRRRVDWLKWCCRHSVLSGSQIRPTVGRKTYDLLQSVLADDGDIRLTHDVFRSFWDLCIQFSLDPDRATEQLTAMVRKATRRQ